MKLRLLIASVACLLPAGLLLADDDRQAKLEREFTERMTNVTLVGHFTMSGREDGKLHEEKYVIESVTKEEGDEWTFLARVQYGDKDVKAPMRLPVKWAGDTPVITLTELAIPLLGTYSARIVIHGDRYAGTWQGGNHGGHLFGKIVKNKDER